MLDKAHEHSRKAIKLINAFIIQNSPTFQGHTVSDIFRNLGLVSVGERQMLPLDEIVPQNLLASSDRAITNWLDLYHWVLQDTVYFYMGQYQINPARFVLEGVKQTFHLFARAVNSCEDLPATKKYAPRMSILMVEYAICQRSPLAERPEWIALARQALFHADAIFLELGKEDILHEIDLNFPEISTMLIAISGKWNTPSLRKTR